MATDPPPPVQVSYTPEFKRNLRQLSKKYRHIKADLQPILDALTAGSKPGDQVPGVRFELFKIRAKNTDALKGKSGGYRIIYYVKSSVELVLITIYSKSEQADITPEEIRQIILNLEATPNEGTAAEADPDKTA